MIKKVLIVVPPLVQNKDDNAQDASRPDFESFRLVSPIEPMTVASDLLARGFEPRIFDMGLFPGDRIALLRGELQNFQPDAMALVQSILTFATAQDWDGEQAFFACRDICPGCVTILTGSHPTNYPGKAVESGICDYSIKGEVDLAIGRLISALNAGEPPNEIEGISFRREDESCFHSDKYPRVDLRYLPRPAYHLLSAEQHLGYAEILERGKIRFPEKSPRYRDVMTSRGCALRCSFCSVANFRGPSQARRKKGIEQILGELDDAFSSGIEEIHFFDDLFAWEESEILDLCEAFIKRGFRFPWFVAQGMPLWPITRDALKAMSETGMYRIICPFETGSDRVLTKVIGKVRSSTEHHHNVIDWASQLGLEIIGMFVVGLPEERRDEILATLRFAEDHPQIDYSVFSIATPMVGTRLMKTVTVQGKLHDRSTIDRVIKRTVALYETDQFSQYEMGILRTFDWDRVNFSTPERQQKYAQMTGISASQLEQTRAHSRQTFYRFFPDYDGPLSFAALYEKPHMFESIKPRIPTEAY